MICDFCSAPNPRWKYPAQDFDAWRVNNVAGRSIGLWAACDHCDELIRKGDWEGLARYSAEKLIVNTPISFESALVGIKLVQSGFRDHGRINERKPIHEDA